MAALGGRRFHRVIALSLVSIALAARWFLRDLRLHPANFTAPSTSRGLRLRAGLSERERRAI